MSKITKKEKRALVGFKDLKLRVILIPLFSFFYPILVFGIWPDKQPLVFLQCFTVGIIHILIFWWVDFWIVLRVRRKFSGVENYQKRLIVTGVYLLISTFLLTFLSHIPDLCFKTIESTFEVPFFVKFMASLIITVIIISIYEGTYNFAQFKEGMLKNEALQKANAQAQLAVLKNQVNPHFLFNSLNTLISVIPDNQDTAVAFAENLSKVYRYLLEIKDKEVIPLAEEFKCIKAYEYLLKIRFGDGVSMEYPNLAMNNKLHIIPLSIQMLIENAIKHNIVSQNKPLRIQIAIENDQLIVKNNLQPKKILEPSTKIGLANIDKRYELLMDKHVNIQKTANEFIVRIPLVKMNEIK